MAKVNPSSLQDYQDGQVITSGQYEQDREMLYVASNDTYDRLVKSFNGLDAAGALKFAQAIDTAVNILKLQEGSSLVITNPSAGVIKFDVVLSAGTVGTTALADGSVTSQKLDPNILNTIQGIDLGIHRTATVLDHPDQSVTTAKIKDGNVTTIKIGDAQVTLAKLAQDVQDMLNMIQALYHGEVFR
jgi:hypothetical protein